MLIRKLWCKMAAHRGPHSYPGLYTPGCDFGHWDDEWVCEHTCRCGKRREINPFRWTPDDVAKLRAE